MLQGVLSRMLPHDIWAKYIIFEGKQDLEKQMIRRIKGWMAPDSFFLIMRDQDSGDCIDIKNSLAGKIIESKKQDNAIIRIACHELESFYLGDLAAVEQGLGVRGISRQQNNKKYRSPDILSNASDELKKISKNQYQKIAGSRFIAPHLKIDGSNKSHSFNILIEGIKKITGLQDTHQQKVNSPKLLDLLHEFQHSETALVV